MKLVVLDIPLLFETDRIDRIDGVIVVSAPARLQRERVMRRPGMTADRFAAVLASQFPDHEKQRLADFVVSTALSRAAAARQITAIVRRVKSGVWRRSLRLRRLRGREACGKS
jgi:dephospho-CoA kinase